MGIFAAAGVFLYLASAGGRVREVTVRLAAGAFCALVLGAGLAGIQILGFERAAETVLQEGRTVQLAGMVESCARQADGSARYVLRLEAWGEEARREQAGQHCGAASLLPYQTCRILLRDREPEGTPERLVGRRILFAAAPEMAQTNGNPRCFNYRVYLRTKGIALTASLGQYEEVGPGDGLHRLTGRLLLAREAFLASLPCGAEEKSFLRGVLFGDTSEMEEAVLDDFRSNGTAHILAVSGLHIGRLYGIYRSLRKKLRSKFLTAGFAALLITYGTMTGWPVSVLRAAALILLMLAGEEGCRRYDLLTSAAAAAALILLRNPCAILGASFQMSFLAILTIAFLTPVLARIIPESAAAAVGVQTGLLPYQACVFGQIPLNGLVSNLPTLFLLSMTVPAGVIAYLLYLGTSALPGGEAVLAVPAEWAGRVLTGLAGMLLRVNHLLSAEGRFLAAVNAPPGWLTILFYAGLFYLTSEFRFVHRAREDREVLRFLRQAFVVAAAVLVFTGASPFDRADIVFVDVGQGDCLHVKGRAGADLLFDGGGSTDYNIGEKVLATYLLHNRRGRAEVVFATHLHTDHYLGLQQLDACGLVGETCLEGTAGDVFTPYPGITIRVLWPLAEHAHDEEKGAEGDENLYSRVYRIETKGISVLVTGDITAEGEAMLVEKYAGTDLLDCDVLKVAHHGSKYSSSAAFLEAVSPEAAVIGVGAHNLYGHPAPETLKRLAAQSIPVYRTDLDGAIGIRRKGGKLLVCTGRPRQST